MPAGIRADESGQRWRGRFGSFASPSFLSLSLSYFSFLRLTYAFSYTLSLSLCVFVRLNFRLCRWSWTCLTCYRLLPRQRCSLVASNCPDECPWRERTMPLSRSFSRDSFHSPLPSRVYANQLTNRLSLSFEMLSRCWNGSVCMYDQLPVRTRRLISDPFDFTRILCYLRSDRYFFDVCFWNVWKLMIIFFFCDERNYHYMKEKSRILT